MKNSKMIPVVCALLSACGELPQEAESPALPSAEQPAPAEVREGTSNLHTDTLRAGPDCGAVIPLTDGEYVLSEIKQLEDIHLSGCTSFSGNVRVYFTTPIVPTAQRYLFNLAQVKEVTGAIQQSAKGGFDTKQTVLFTGLERAGSVELSSQLGCPYQALQTANTVFVKSVGSCDLPALQAAKDMYITSSMSLLKLNRLASLDSLLIDHSLITVNGFAALKEVKQLTLYNSFGGTVKGSFPALTTVGSLRSTNQDLCGLKMPLLTTVTGDITLQKNRCSLAPLSALATVGGNLSVQEAVPFDREFHQGPASLTQVGGHLSLKIDPEQITGYNRLQTIGGTLTIETTKTESLNGFKALTSLGGLNIKADGMSIEGFSKLTTIQGPVTIQHAASMSGFSALRALTTIKGPFTVSTTSSCTFAKLSTVEGSMRYSQRAKYGAYDPFPALTTVLGDLETVSSSSGYELLTTVTGSLSILNVLKDYTGMYSISGYKSLKTVGKDLILDKAAISFGPFGTQRLVDQLVGFTGHVIQR